MFLNLERNRPDNSIRRHILKMPGLVITSCPQLMHGLTTGLSLKWEFTIIRQHVDYHTSLIINSSKTRLKHTHKKIKTQKHIFSITMDVRYSILSTAYICESIDVSLLKGLAEI
jgi:hypothetical protein